MSKDVERMVSRLRAIGYTVTPPDIDDSEVKTLPQRLKSLRVAHSFSLQRVADEVGSAKTYIWQIENKSDGHRFSAHLIFKLARLYGVEPEWLFYGDPLTQRNTQ